MSGALFELFGQLVESTPWFSSSNLLAIPDVRQPELREQTEWTSGSNKSAIDVKLIPVSSDV
jgi:hypothetical protein